MPPAAAAALGPPAAAARARALISRARAEGATALVAKPFGALTLDLGLDEHSSPLILGTRFRRYQLIPAHAQAKPQPVSQAVTASATVASNFLADPASYCPQDFLRGPDAALLLADGQQADLPWALVDSGSEVSLLDQAFCDRYGITYSDPGGLSMRTADSSVGKLVGITRRLKLLLAPGTADEASLSLQCLVVSVQGMAYSALLGKGVLKQLGAVVDPRRNLLHYDSSRGSRASLTLHHRTELSSALLRLLSSAAVWLEPQALLAPAVASHPLPDCPEECCSDCSSESGEGWAEGSQGGSSKEDPWRWVKGFDPSARELLCNGLSLAGQRTFLLSFAHCLKRVAEDAHYARASPAARAAMLPRLLKKARQLQVEAAARTSFGAPTYTLNLVPKVGACRPVMAGGWATNMMLAEEESARTRAARMARAMARGGETAKGSPLDPGQDLFRGGC